MFEFVNCRADPRFDATCWYLIVRGDDQKTFEAVHKGVCHMLYHRFDADPHIQRDKEREPGMYSIFNVAHMGGMWCQGIEKMFSAYGLALVGTRGGFRPGPCEESEVLARIKRRELIWPDADAEITVSKWPEGRHWYLSAKGGMVFSPHRFNTQKGAVEWATKISSNVKVKSR
jgi:hypothetical protein